ncbi:MAG TPA: hypothetical protein PLL30_17280 [Candidatus Krumholzibacteria bacterium]|nr:hypothetical protein [Candidatus Krumholzibacteria bacterium]HRY42250.1 hypothetical protein [Candidatus Krumholzibacteria bacterium]
MRTTGESTRATREDRERELEALWQPIEQALNRRDPMAALEEIGRVKQSMRHAMSCRVEDWLTMRTALPQTEAAPWPDRDGLYRLIFLVWPELPIRCFNLAMLPDLFAALDRYDRKYRGSGSWIEK